MFDRYARGGRSLQVASQGLLLGRARRGAGRADGRGDELFRARRGVPRTVLRPAGARAARPRRCRRPAALPTVLVTDAAAHARSSRSGWSARCGCSASRASRAEQTLFVRALVRSARQRGRARPRVRTGDARSGARTWRCGPRARRATPASPFTPAPAFPTHSANVPGGRIWSLVHGITRQESSFDRTRGQPRRRARDDAADARHRARAGRQDGRRL